MISRDSASPLHEQVAGHIRQQIRDGVYEIGTKLPSLKTLREDLAVSEVTVHTAIRELQRDGVLVSSPGRGTFVQAIPNEPSSLDDDDALKQVQQDVRRLTRRIERLERAVEPGPNATD